MQGTNKDCCSLGSFVSRNEWGSRNGFRSFPNEIHFYTERNSFRTVDSEQNSLLPGRILLTNFNRGDNGSDSSCSVGCWAKGRSSSYRMNSICRKQVGWGVMGGHESCIDLLSSLSNTHCYDRLRVNIMITFARVSTAARLLR